MKSRPAVLVLSLNAPEFESTCPNIKQTDGTRPPRRRRRERTGHDNLKSLIQTRDTRSIRVFLIGVELKSRTAADIRESLAELAELAETAGTQIIGEGVQKMAVPVAATYIGPGKAAEFAASCKANDVDTIIFDDELSPAQTRNLEKIFGCKIMDRTALILEIFGQRARTREGKLQPKIFSRLRVCAGESSSSKMMVSTSFALQDAANSAALPGPM